MTALEAAVELANLETTAHPTAGADFVEDAEEKIAFYTGLMDCTGTYQCYQKELTDGTITTEDVGVPRHAEFLCGEWIPQAGL